MVSDLRTDWQRRNLSLRVTHPQVQAAADACEKLAKMIVNKDTLFPTLVLHGNPGCGKTTLGKRMIAWARANAHPIMETHWKYSRGPLSIASCHWPDTCDTFKTGEYGIVQDLCSADLAFIDDIGSEHDPSQSAANKLCQILTRRESLWSIYTTNTGPDLWAGKWDSRVEDRLMRRSFIVDMSKVPSFATV